LASTPRAASRSVGVSCAKTGSKKAASHTSFMAHHYKVPVDGGLQPAQGFSLAAREQR